MDFVLALPGLALAAGIAVPRVQRAMTAWSAQRTLQHSRLAGLRH